VTTSWAHAHALINILFQVHLFVTFLFIGGNREARKGRISEATFGCGFPALGNIAIERCPEIDYAVRRGKNGTTTNRKEMQMPTSATNTIRIHRVLRATPERIYRAFLDEAAMSKWLPPNGFTGKIHHLDVKIGGTYKMSFTNFTTGKSHSFGGTYLELLPHERIRYTDKFDDPNLPGEMQTTIALKKVSCGTELNVVQEGVPGVIPPEACYLGWQESLILLSKLVEAEIPDQP
jgi:uncharacterized protein YndB with AHSA1/START domain